MNTGNSQLTSPRELYRDISQCREDFPVLSQKINGEALVYLDSAASSQQPLSVI
jgi:cysteine desulfurase/selenocysteine lyase